MERDLVDRVERLEQAVERLEAVQRQADRRDAVDGRAGAELASTWPPPTVEIWDAPLPIRAASDAPRTPFPDTEALLKWSGIGLVVLAIGFAVSTAISRGWIGPELQLAGALGLSLALIVIGLRLRPSRPAWTVTLCVGGVLGWLITAASPLLRDQLNDDIALGAIAASGLLGLALADRLGSERVAATAFAGGMIGWAVVAADDLPFVASTVWFAVFVTIMLARTTVRSWHALRPGAHLAGMVTVLGLASEAATDADRIVICVIGVAAFGALAWLPSRGSETLGWWQRLEIQLVMSAPPWALLAAASVFDLDGDGSVGSTAFVVAAGTLLTAGAVRDRIRTPHLISLLVGASVVVSIGVALVLSVTGAWLAVSVQAAGLVVLARSLDDDVRVAINAAIVGSLSAAFVLAAMVEAWDDDAALVDDLAHLAIIIALLAASWLSGARPIRQAAGVAGVGAVLLWLGSVLSHLPQGHAIVSMSWTVVGVTVFVTAALRKVPEMGAIGLTVIAVTVAKLLTVDLREVDTLWRAGLFLVVGLGIMRLGFLLPRLTRDRPDPDPVGTDRN